MELNLDELVEVAASLGTDYYKLRAAVIRREVRGERRAGRWFCDWDSARRWKEARQGPEPVSAV